MHGFLGCLILTLAVFIRPLFLLTEHALRVGLDSYILLVPFISAYLLNLDRQRLPRDFASSPAWAGGFAAAGLAALAAGWRMGTPGESGGDNTLAFAIMAFLCWIVAVGFFFLGRDWIAHAVFPIAFLIFMVPLPGAVVERLESASKFASAEVASQLFDLSGTPNLRDGLYFQLPDITIEVAQECSGIRSSLVLFVTGLLVAHVFLRSAWRQTLLVLLVIPLGFVRNGFRIWVIGQLCVYMGPDMIHSIIHKRGGPVFFALSLLPVFGVGVAAGRSNG